ncbi:uncharacterized protein LTR77_003218 [Saxophila tyrrhenica]|uniref:Uncharacterized protein n=1 Tax=Saxophila tyrrhenica TaxID=1690608 RepID=A0AAV9PHA0_9PEZI|nr:hypothetical protein LTR77_003218 [Saxophila tyrrhenica]
MATTPARQDPNVQHRFDGDVKVLNSSGEARAAIRKALSALHQNVHVPGNVPVQISADIKIGVAGADAKQHTYTVTVTSNDFDAGSFAQQVPSASAGANASTPSVRNVTPGAATPANGQPGHAHPTPQPGSRKVDEDDDVVEIRPFKRPKLKDSTSSPALGQKGAQAQKGSTTEQTFASREDEMYHLTKGWNTEWKQQGGWLFDNITKLNAANTNNTYRLESKMASVQDVLGNSINSANLSVLNELANVSTKLIPWLETCRKTSADSMNARSEKWRTSSANFHDQTRREREAAEQRIERKLEEQRELLLRLAKASGVDAQKVQEAGAIASREESLGAQLTAELNMEAEKS